MEPTALSPAHRRIAASQRELLALILGRALGRSARFTEALDAVEHATGVEGARAITRELLSDLAIRDWIELRRKRPTGAELPIERLRYELELAADRNWSVGSDEPRALYALTAKGRGKVRELPASALERP